MSSNGPVERSKSAFNPITWGLAAAYLVLYVFFLFVIDTAEFLDTQWGQIIAVVTAVVFVINFFVVRWVLMRAIRAKAAAEQDD